MLSIKLHPTKAEATMFAVGQQWVNPEGATYTIRAKLRRGWEVTLSTYDGAVTASNGTFRFHDHKFRNLIEAAKLKLYDRSDDLDYIANKLDHKGHSVLASVVDAISQEFVEARPPSETNRIRRDDMREQVDIIVDKMEEADDPENIERLEEELRDSLRELESVDDLVSPANEVTPPAGVRRTENVSDDYHISK